MIHLEISEGYDTLADAPLLERSALTALAHHYPGDEAELTIVITGDEQMRQLNHDYRGIDSATDVLSFPADFIDPESDTPYLGDVLISYPRAAVQAETAGHAVTAELQLLVVHGVLHLLGYDHATEEEKSQMWAAQAQALAQLGLGNLRIVETDQP